jgi:hypothetical protein
MRDSLVIETSTLERSYPLENSVVRHRKTSAGVMPETIARHRSKAAILFGIEPGGRRFFSTLKQLVARARFP